MKSGPTEQDDFDLMWSLHVARDISRDRQRAEALLWPCWLALWRRIARDHLMGFVWWAATGELLHGYDAGTFPPICSETRSTCREYLRRLGVLPVDHA